MLLDGGGQAQDLLLSGLPEDEDVRNAEAALGERASLVEDDGVDQAGALEGGPVADQEAAPRAQARRDGHDERHG
jgi:hypothetical protein